jgi:hypothetical protein
MFVNHAFHPLQRMLDFDHICKRETPSVAGLITPGTTEVFDKGE